MRDHEAFWLLDGKAKDPEEIHYRNLGTALRAHPDLYERFDGEVRDLMTGYIRTLDPALLDRHNEARGLVLSELASRGARWPRPGARDLGYMADNDGGIASSRRFEGADHG